MPQDIQSRILEVRRQLDLRRELRESLSATRDTLGQERYRLQEIEIDWGHARQGVEALQALTPEYIVNLLLGRKARLLAERREECAAWQQEHDNQARNIADLERAAQAMEQQLTELGDLDQTLESLCAIREKQIIERGDESAGSLAALGAEISRVQEEQGKVDKALQVGKHAMERLHSLNSAAGRARNKRVGVHGVGVLTMTVVNTVLVQSANPSAQRAGEGLRSFALALNDLDLSAGDHRCIELIRLGVAIGECASDVAGRGTRGIVNDSSVTSSILDVVQETIGHLKEAAEGLKKRGAELTEQRAQYLETA